MLKKQIFNQTHLWIFLNLDYGSRALSTFLMSAVKTSSPPVACPHYTARATPEAEAATVRRGQSGGIYSFMFHEISET